jgi:hypothetical protein
MGYFSRHPGLLKKCSENLSSFFCITSTFFWVRAVTEKSVKQIQLEYALHIHGIVFRVAGTVFATLPVAKRVTISGFSQRIDRATGKVSDDYLLSACIERDLYSKINFSSLDKVNPIDALGVFEIRRNITSTGLIRAIEPFKP